MEIGTPHFVNARLARRYYREYGIDSDEVNQKITEGEISIGKPEPYGPDWAVVVNLKEGRYFQKKRVITRSKWESYHGETCKYYCEGCATCDGWTLWSEISGEKISYEEHDYFCACGECPSKADRVEAKRIDHGVE